MSDKTFLADAYKAHVAGNDKQAADLILDGIQHYSYRLSRACSGIMKSDVPLLTFALLAYYKANYAGLNEGGKGCVDLLDKIVDTVAIHN